MTSFRIRAWGSADWTVINLSSDEEDELLEGLADHIRDFLCEKEAHVQEMGEDGRWEDL